MQKNATIYEIAKTAGVSPASVSRMIHEPNIVSKKTREKILAAFEQHNMLPENLKTRKKHQSAFTKKAAQQNTVILVCIPTWENVFYNDILEGITDHLMFKHYHIIVSNELPQRGTMASFLSYCASLHIAGIIIMYPLAEDMLRQIHAVYPVVQCSEYNPLFTSVPYVSVDDYTISKTALMHLINCGCKQIGFFCASFNYRYVQNRYRAYKAVLNGNNLAVPPEYVISVTDDSYSLILSAAENFFTLPNPPDAIFATSDKHAHAIIKAGQNMGFSIPQDIKVFGFDNSIYAQLSTPTISTVEQPRHEIGVQSASMLLKLIQNPMAQVSSLLLPTRLVLQESTK